MTPLEQEFYDGLDPAATDLQNLIDSGMWSMEGHMGRAMMLAITNGECILGPSPAFDYWGNYIPSRYEVEPGTKGSVEYALRLREEYA
jgi:hypothetical protein